MVFSFLYRVKDRMPFLQMMAQHFIPHTARKVPHVFSALPISAK
jgi:hypothetical protein